MLIIYRVVTNGQENVCICANITTHSLGSLIVMKKGAKDTY